MPPGASSRRLHLRSSSTLVRSQHFKAARNVSFGDTNLSTVRGNQFNNYTIQEKKKAIQFIGGTEEEEAEYDQFLEIKLGEILALENIHRGPGRVFNKEQKKWVTLGEQAVVVGEVKIEGMASKCTVVSYSGDGAKQLWKTDFQRFGGVRSAEKAQMVGINRSKVPMIILTGGLVPAAHLIERAGRMGQLYLKALARQMGCWEDNSLWMDASRGVFCRGPEGPSCSRRGVLVLKDLPSDTELLREEVVIRYLASRKEDLEVLFTFCFLQHEDTSRIRVSRPTIISTLTNTTLAVGGVRRKEDKDSCVGEREVLANGTTRFTLKDDRCRLRLELKSTLDWWDWQAQALSVFQAHGIPLEGDMRAYKLICPEKLTATLSNSRVKRQRRQNCPPIYLFLSSSILWSFDPTGQTSISNDLCRYLGLPPIPLPECTEYSWPTELYKTLLAYRAARGFDPTTTDFAQDHWFSLFEPEEQPLPSRFEEINHSVSIFASSPPCSLSQLEAGVDQQELEDFSLELLFGDIQLEAPENVTSDASTVHTSRFNCPIRTGPPSIPSQKESTGVTKKPLAVTSARTVARQTVSGLKSPAKPVLPRSTHPSTVPAKPRFSTTATKPIQLSTSKTSPPRGKLTSSDSGTVKYGTKETLRLRERVAGTENTAVDTRHRNPRNSGITTTSMRKETSRDTNAWEARSTLSRESPVVPTRKTSCTSIRTTRVPSILRRSGPDIEQRAESTSGVRARTGKGSNGTRLHRPDQTKTSSAHRPTAPKSSNLNPRATTVPSTRLHLASTGATEVGGRGTAMDTNSTQSTASRPRLGRSLPVWKGVAKRRLDNNNDDEHIRKRARTSKESRDPPPPPNGTQPNRSNQTATSTSAGLRPTIPRIRFSFKRLASTGGTKARGGGIMTMGSSSNQATTSRLRLAWEHSVSKRKRDSNNDNEHIQKRAQTSKESRDPLPPLDGTQSNQSNQTATSTSAGLRPTIPRIRLSPKRLARTGGTKARGRGIMTMGLNSSQATASRLRLAREHGVSKRKRDSNDDGEHARKRARMSKKSPDAF